MTFHNPSKTSDGEVIYSTGAQDTKLTLLWLVNNVTVREQIDKKKKTN